MQAQTAKRGSKKTAAPVVNHKAVLLDKMKALTPLTPEAREAFRDDVAYILEGWDGESFLWTAWDLDTHMLMLGSPHLEASEVQDVKRELMVLEDMARGATLYSCDVQPDGSFLFGETSFADARRALDVYFDDKTPCVSAHA